MPRVRSVLPLVIVVALLSADTASADPGDFVHEAPTEGLVQLVTARDFSIQELVDALESEGCDVGSINLWVNFFEVYVAYVPGAPETVNGSFPRGLARYTPVFVRCLPPVINNDAVPPRVGEAPRIESVEGVDVPLHYECGDAEFTITHWFVPEYLTDMTQSANIWVTYKVPADGEDYNVQLLLDPADANAKLLKNTISGPLVLSPNDAGRVGQGVIDGISHETVLTIHPIYTEDEVDRSVPHFFLKNGERFSDTRPFPFYLNPPPVVWGWWFVGTSQWRIDTRLDDYCTEPLGE